MTQQTSKWEVRVDKQRFILTGEEVTAVLAGHNQRFIKLKGVIINPAFIQSMVQISEEKDEPLQLAQPPLTKAQIERNAKLRAEAHRRIGK